MTTTTPVRGAEASLTVTSIDGLANAAFAQTQSVDVTAQISGQLEVYLGTTATAGSATAYCNVYIAPSNDGANFAGAAGAIAASYAPNPSAGEQIKNCIFLGTVWMKADEVTARTYRRVFDLPKPDSEMGPLLPSHFAVIVENQTGAALASTGNEIVWKPVNLTTA